MRDGLSVAAVSDELSRDFATAAELASRYGIAVLELRNLCTGRVPEISLGELEEVLRFRSEFGLRIETISPGLCKQEFAIGADAQDLLTVNRALLDSSMRFAERVGAQRLITFGFRRTKPTHSVAILPPELVEIIQAMASIAKRCGFSLMLENHSSCFVNTTSSAVAVASQIEGGILQLNWDPYNCWFAGGNVGSVAFAGIPPRVRQIHAKDGRRVGGSVERTPLGSGDIPWDVIVNAARLAAAPIQLVLETHARPRIARFEADLTGLRRLMGA
jgi:sugar phosphate isomerase/epimerase